ncbi:MAG: ATP-grasp domain-containing protein, partial [Bacteroidales bacterium]|nr:ATP-grasp domain-containing protein [Bacteroidales bacterium]
ASQLDGSKYNVYEVFARFGDWRLVAYRVDGGERVLLPADGRPSIDRNDFSVLLDGARVRFDFAYIMQHGNPGENGLMQGYLEMLGIPFSSCSAFVSAITFDKFCCKSYLRDVDFVRLPEDVLIRRGDSLKRLASVVGGKFGWPVFVKPTDGGSSFGVLKVRREEDFEAAVEKAFEEGGTERDSGGAGGAGGAWVKADCTAVLAERAVVGREITCAVYSSDGQVVALPVVEIVTGNDFFDYDAKYLGKSNEICPADLPEDVAEMIQCASAKIYKRLGCSGCVRMDYILAEDGLYFLELNTVPGMTAASLVPKMVRAAGLSITDFLSTVIENA